MIIKLHDNKIMNWNDIRFTLTIDNDLKYFKKWVDLEGYLFTKYNLTDKKIDELYKKGVLELK